MSFIKQGKTNWVFLLIIVFIAFVVFELIAWYGNNTGYSDNQTINPPVREKRDGNAQVNSQIAEQKGEKIGKMTLDKCSGLQDEGRWSKRYQCVYETAIANRDSNMCGSLVKKESQDACYRAIGLEIGSAGNCGACDKIENIAAKRYCMLNVASVSEDYKFCDRLDINIEDYFKKYTDKEFGFSFYYPKDDEPRLSGNKIYLKTGGINISKIQTSKGYLFSSYVPAGGAIGPWMSYIYFDENKGKFVKYFKNTDFPFEDPQVGILIDKETGDNRFITKMPPVGYTIKESDFSTIFGLVVFSQEVRFGHFNIVCLDSNKFLEVNYDVTGTSAAVEESFTNTIARTGQIIENNKIKKALANEFLSVEMVF